MKIIRTLALLLISCSLYSSSKPNIIYILSDDQGWGDASCYNPKSKIQTPGIDRIAAEGLQFTNAHSSASVCTPSRYGLLTGRYAWRTHLQTGVLATGAPPLITSDQLTVATLAKNAGYTTAIIGKWHLGFSYENHSAESGKTPKIGSKIIGSPTERGFDLYKGFHHAREMEVWIEDDHVKEIIDPSEMLPKITTCSVQYIHYQASNNDLPFFLYVPLSSPHTPIVPTKEWQGKSGIGAYGDFVMQTDHAVVEILKALDNTGLAENTLVFFTADNGCSKKADLKALAKHGHDPMAGLNGYKASTYEGGHRVPFVARWPKIISPNSVSDALICNTSLMATMAETFAIQLKDNEGVDSFSILPHLKGDQEHISHPQVVHHSFSGEFAMTEKNWKYQGKKDKKTGTYYLYNLTDDLGEKTNLIQQHPEKAEALLQQLNTVIRQGRSTPGVPQSNDAEVIIFKAKSSKASKKSKQKKDKKIKS